MDLSAYFNSLSHEISGNSVAVAVSGGADSMALCLSIKTWCDHNGIQLHAITIDHKLRSESTQEAHQVHQWLSEKGVTHQILEWHHGGISSKIQEQARDARYSLLIKYCHDNQINALFFGHHLYDQVETFLSRITHKSGLKGLGGMHSVTEKDNIKIIRPFLNIHPNLLKEYLQSINQPWIEDPSNQNLRYERIRWRQFIPTLETQGLTAEKIFTVSNKLQAEDQALDWAAEDWISRNTELHNEFKFFKIDFSLRELPPSLIKRIMLAIASRVRGIPLCSTDVRHDMNAPIQKLSINSFKAFTFCGCYCFYSKGFLWIVREWSKCPKVIVDTVPFLYDHRFLLTDIEIGHKLEPIGLKNWPNYKEKHKGVKLPHYVYLSLPIITK